MRRPICVHCSAYMGLYRPEEREWKDWRKCPTCGWCCDKNGKSKISKKEEIAILKGRDKPKWMK